MHTIFLLRLKWFLSNYITIIADILKSYLEFNAAVEN
jgi:hypothetical protein